jgi:hypothetical protein
LRGRWAWIETRRRRSPAHRSAYRSGILRSEDSRSGPPYRRDVASGLVTAGAAAGTTTLLAFRSGGYFPSEWGLEIGFFALVALVALILSDSAALTVTRREALVAAAFIGLAVWSLASISWSSGADAPVLSAERVLIYVSALCALLLGLSRDRVPWLLGGAATGIVVVCTYALATRLFAGSMGGPADAVTGTRLAEPIGYANALGALAAMAVVLAVGFLFHERPELRVAAGAALVPLSVTLYFTLSRGSLIALAIGLLAFLGVERSGHAIGGLLLVATPSAAGVLLAIRSPLLDGRLSMATAQSNGHRLAWELALLAAASGAVAVVARPLARTLVPVAWVGIAGAAALAAAAVVWAGPEHLAHRVADSFRTPPPATTGNQTARLLSGSASGRSEYWAVARQMVAREPVLGEGAGSYERWWLQERPVANDARNAHNLYLEMLAELGPVGLVLLLVALVTPLFAPAARDPVTAGALGAYLAWLAHALLDWDWQIPGVTLVALGCAGALLVTSRPSRDPLPGARARRPAALAVLVVLLAAGLVAHAGNRAADASQSALDGANPSKAASAARRARTWMPWAAQPWQLLGEAELEAHQDAGARADLQRAVERDPASWSAWYDLAAASHGAAKSRALVRARALNPLALR